MGAANTSTNGCTQQPCTIPEPKRDQKTEVEEEVTQETMWQHDVEAMKEEAAKRKARREEEAAARKARIEEAERLAEADSQKRQEEVVGPSTAKKTTAKKKAAPKKAPEAPAPAPAAVAPAAEKKEEVDEVAALKAEAAKKKEEEAKKKGEEAKKKEEAAKAEAAKAEAAKAEPAPEKTPTVKKKPAPKAPAGKADAPAEKNEAAPAAEPAAAEPAAAEPAADKKAAAESPTPAPASEEPTQKKSSVKKKAAPKAAEKEAEEAAPEKAPEAPPKTPEQLEKEKKLQQEIDQAIAITKDPNLVRYNLEIKIVSARDVSSGDADPFVTCVTTGRGATKFRTKPSANKTTPVWNQASKMQLGEGESLLFAVLDKDEGANEDFLGRATLTFDKIVPSGFEGEILLEESVLGKETEAFLKVRIRVASAVAGSL
eukprot:TRINITY_DN14719_c0_g1_i2.p1 TRINITY_DN14719_c0_g1~~TRINITY_DN14719_c0_g1_i2.p1  ORF type:complete len:428 (+),score=156.66 TRINITY_DN14719_c0_g1_i2:102-1385(+)